MDPQIDSYASPDTDLVVRQDPEVQLSAFSYLIVIKMALLQTHSWWFWDWVQYGEYKFPFPLTS